MFGTRRLERFDLHALRNLDDARREDAPESAPSGDGKPMVVDASGVVAESGEHPTTRTLEIPTPRVDIRPLAMEELPAPPVHDEPEAVRAPDPDALRTRLTRKFVSLAEMVNDAFRGMPLDEAAYTVELTSPQGMSTGGGKQALLHLRLHPRREGFAVILAGTVNPVAHRAELRDYEHIAAWHYVRFERPVPLSRQLWEEFLRRAESVLRDAGIESVRVPRPVELALELRRRTSRVSKPATAVFVAVLLLAAVACVRVAMLLLHR